ncbi:hypothetical protein PILCRDRAFT_1521 [Piloderma croceum F 1598]|uniref:Uncharacterized protein n=1 Tax=Piloderma croceum (strain F 1598) TaxID=765440 RepID=A0A0C3G1M3_PILCF|nr:hypothetical protein PILCRDRAFT_1521 [Piloderma croceum F 1598]
MSNGDQLRISASALNHARSHISDNNLTGADMRRKLSNLMKEAPQVVRLINLIGEFGRHNKVAPFTALLAACHSTLEVFSAGGLHADIVCYHPVYDLCVHVDQLIPDCAPNAPDSRGDFRSPLLCLEPPFLDDFEKQTSVLPRNDTALSSITYFRIDYQSNHDAMSCISLSSIHTEASDLLHTIQTGTLINPDISRAETHLSASLGCFTRIRRRRR